MSSRVFAAAVAAGISLGTVHGAIWENTGWALTGDASGELVYDSNLFGRADDVSDTFVSVVPGLMLQRKGSLTRLELRGQAEIRRFFDLSDENSVDPLLDLTYAYPVSDEDLINQEAQLRYNRRSYRNTDLGARIRSADYLARWEGNLVDTGKTTFGARARFERNDVSWENGQSDRVRVGVFAGFMPRGLLMLRAGYDYFRETFESDDAADRRRTAHQLTLQARGELAPKWTGSVELGLLDSSFSGISAGSGMDWSLSSNVNYEPTERDRLNLSAGRNEYFTVEGGAATVTNLDVRYYRGFSGGYGANFRAGYQTVGADSIGAIEYDVIVAGVSLEYDMTGRLRAQVGFDWRDNDASDPVYDYSGVTTFVRASYSF